MQSALKAKGIRHRTGHPAKPVYARMGRFGPMVQIGGADEDDTPRFASLQKARALRPSPWKKHWNCLNFRLLLGDYEGKEVSVNAGRFGPYISNGAKVLFLPKGRDLLTVDLTKATKLIEENKSRSANRELWRRPQPKAKDVLALYQVEWDVYKCTETI